MPVFARHHHFAGSAGDIDNVLREGEAGQFIAQLRHDRHLIFESHDKTPGRGDFLTVINVIRANAQLE
ncbi:hypothetical protein D3C80_1866580 [compost metagenome]